MTRWLASLQAASAAPRLRLVCFPFAGGGPAVYRQWPRLLPREVEILSAHLPGREGRIADALEIDPDVVAAELVSAIACLAPAPTLFFGHSLGALLAYEVAFRLSRAGSVHTPRRVVLSGCAPPHAGRHRDEGPAWELPDDLFVGRLRELEGTPEEVLASRELLELYLPVLRSDFHLSHNAKMALQPGLAVDVHVLGGVNDIEATGEDLRQWKAYLGGEPPMTLFAGGHFFLAENPQQVCAFVHRQLAAMSFPSDIRIASSTA